MKLRDTLDSIVPDPAAGQVYGQPYETPDGVTVVPVAGVRGRTRPGAQDAGLRLTARPVGVFVIKDGDGDLGARGRFDPDRVGGSAHRPGRGDPRHAGYGSPPAVARPARDRLENQVTAAPEAISATSNSAHGHAPC